MVTSMVDGDMHKSGQTKGCLLFYCLYFCCGCVVVVVVAVGFGHLLLLILWSSFAGLSAMKPFAEGNMTNSSVCTPVAAADKEYGR